MKNILIVNPKAGAENSLEMIRREVKAFPEHIQVEIYETQGVGDATTFIRKWSLEHPGESVRFIACGGDGTVNEVVNGVVKNPAANFSVYPCGSGNDFVKCFGGPEHFQNLQELCTCGTQGLDLLKVGDRYADNVVHFGFDTVVATTMNERRDRRGHGDAKDYFVGVAKALFTGRRNEVRVMADGELLNPDGIAMLSTVANGQYVGGAFRCAPRAKTDDGWMEVCVIKPVSILRFLKLVGPYMRGEHLDREDMQSMLTYRRAKLVEVQAPEGFSFSLDGEIIREHAFSIQIIPHAVQFAIP